MATLELKNAGWEGAAAPASNTLSVQLVYEDLRTGMRARRALHQAQRLLDPPFAFRWNLWRFDVLDDIRLRERAAAEAQEAHMLVLAWHGELALPLPVVMCLEEWLQGRGGQPGLLVVSLDSRHQDSRGIDVMLRNLCALAQPNGVDVLPQFGPTPTTCDALLDNLQRRALRVTSLMDRLMEPPPWMASPQNSCTS